MKKKILWFLVILLSVELIILGVKLFQPHNQLKTTKTTASSSLVDVASQETTQTSEKKKYSNDITLRNYGLSR